METTKLYYQDPMLQTFTATVLSCEESKGGYAVVLDATAFYPEGGGQGADHGALGGATVTDVRESEGTIVHTCDAPLTVGASVTGTLDWARRFDNMQHHSGEHIISGILCQMFQCHNVGFHMGKDTVTIDYDAEFTFEQALEAERRANDIIWQNAPVEIAYPDAQALAVLNYRSKKALTGAVRIVTFPGADCCACCGTHVVNAGQVGLIKLLSAQKNKGGTRLELVCGGKAMAYYQMLLSQNRDLSQHLSAKPVEVAAAVLQRTTALDAAEYRVTQLEDALFANLAESYDNAGDVLLFQEPMSSNALRRLCVAVAARCGGRCAVFAGVDGQWGWALSMPGEEPILPVVKAMNAALQGRGGGRDGFAQGNATCTKTEIQAYFA